MPTPPTFDDFWKLYPRRVAKKDAMRAWGRLTEDEQARAIVGVQRYARSRVGQDPRYTLHPATYLNGARFDDEPDAPVNPYLNHPDIG